jgi:hypothetical protein
MWASLKSLLANARFLTMATGGIIAVLIRLSTHFGLGLTETEAAEGAKIVMAMATVFVAMETAGDFSRKQALLAVLNTGAQLAVHDLLGVSVALPTSAPAQAVTITSSTSSAPPAA